MIRFYIPFRFNLIQWFSELTFNFLLRDLYSNLLGLQVIDGLHIFYKNSVRLFIDNQMQYINHLLTKLSNHSLFDCFWSSLTFSDNVWFSGILSNLNSTEYFYAFTLEFYFSLKHHWLLTCLFSFTRSDCFTTEIDLGCVRILTGSIKHCKNGYSNLRDKTWSGSVLNLRTPTFLYVPIPFQIIWNFVTGTSFEDTGGICCWTTHV